MSLRFPLTRIPWVTAAKYTGQVNGLMENHSAQVVQINGLILTQKNLGYIVKL